MPRKTTWSLLLVLLFLMPGLGAAPGHAAPVYVLLTTIPVPSNPAGNVQVGAFTGYDIAYFDGTTQLMYLADRSNASVDIFSAQTNSFVGRVGSFVGIQPQPVNPATVNNDISGPDGVVVADHTRKRWAEDRDRRAEDDTGAIVGPRCTDRVEEQPRSASTRWPSPHGIICSSSPTTPPTRPSRHSSTRRPGPS